MPVLYIQKLYIVKSYYKRYMSCP